MHVSLQQRFNLPAIVPPGHLSGFDLAATIDHVLKRISEIPLALVFRPRQRVIDSVKQEFPVANVIEADICQSRNGLGWFLDDPGHVSLIVGNHDAEPPIILNLFHPHDTIGIYLLDQSQIGVKERIDKDDQDRAVHIRPGQIDRACRTVLNDLLYET